MTANGEPLVLSDDYLLQHVAKVVPSLPDAPEGRTLTETLCGVVRWAPRARVARMPPVRTLEDTAGAERLCPACAAALRTRTAVPTNREAATESLLDLLEATP